MFDGPLDLLLHLVKQEELDLYELPVERVATQYLAYLEQMQEMNLEVAGEFLVIAATLVYLKSRSLLPVAEQPPTDEDGDEIDPRWDLIRQLVEYKKFKDAAASLQDSFALQEKTHARGWFETDRLPRRNTSPGVMEVHLVDLVAALQKVLERTRALGPTHEIGQDRWTVSEKMELILERMESHMPVQFEELFPEDASRVEVVVTFLALLELTRLKRICIEQAADRGAITVRAAASTITEAGLQTGVENVAG